MLKKLPRMPLACVQAAQDVRAKREHWMAERRKMNALDAELITKHVIVESAGPGREPGKRITCAECLFLAGPGSPEVLAYYAERAARIAAMGYTLPSPDHCPALIAQSELAAAESLLIAEAVKMPGLESLSVQRLLCAGLDKYREFINLVLKMEEAQTRMDAMDVANLVLSRVPYRTTGRIQ